MLSGRHNTAISRYGAVALVLAKVAEGRSLSWAISEVTKGAPHDLSGHEIRVTERTLFRWVSAYKKSGLDGLCPRPRALKRASRVLSDDFLVFLSRQKGLDPKASLPEIIRRAERLDIVGEKKLSRSTVWQAARKLNLPIFASPGLEKTDMRRFSYTHRMQMVLCDGKHFRAGRGRLRRVALIFLDDATRFTLSGEVGTSESSDFFLGALWTVIKKWGLMRALYIDHGPGFISNDTAVVCARLGIAIVFGRVRYPEGHGKIERFNRTMKADLLRTFSQNPEIDPSISALTIRVRHYLTNEYNRRFHEEIKCNPEDLFLSDPLALSMSEGLDKMERHFVICESRRVSRDQVVTVEGVNYDMPQGYAGKVVEVYRHILHGTVSVKHDNRMVELKPLDLTLNAVTARAFVERQKDECRGPIRSAADISFAKDYQPVVDMSGDFFEKE